MQRKPRILLFIDWYIPGFKAGGPIRSCANMIAALRSEYDFYVVTRDSDYTENQSYEGVISDSWQEGRFGERVYFFSQKNLSRKNLRKLINELDFDIAYINGIYSYYFSILPLILCRRNRNKKIIVSTRGMLASTAIEVKSSKKRLFLNLAKFTGIYRNIIFHATNKEEESSIRKEITSKAKVMIAANFPLAVTVMSKRVSAKKEHVLNVIHLARISPEKNLLFALERMSEITSGTIHFSIYGPIYDQDYYSNCLKQVASLPPNIKVEFRGSLKPELVSETFRKYDLFVMTTNGENFGHSISESLSNGTPVLISDRTPWNDVNEFHCGAALPLEQPALFVDFFRKMLAMNQDEHQQYIDAALQFAAKKNDTTLLIGQYRDLFSV